MKPRCKILRRRHGYRRIEDLDLASRKETPVFGSRPRTTASSDSADDFVRISCRSEGLRHSRGAIAVANQVTGIDAVPNSKCASTAWCVPPDRKRITGFWLAAGIFGAQWKRGSAGRRTEPAKPRMPWRAAGALNAPSSSRSGPRAAPWRFRPRTSARRPRGAAEWRPCGPSGLRG